MAAGPEENKGLPAKFDPRELFKQMSVGQLISLGVIMISGLILVFSVFYYAMSEEKEPLFMQRVDAKTQVQIEQELRSRQIDFEISETGKILVPKSKARALRTEFEALEITPDGRGGMAILESTNPLEAGEQMMKLRSIEALKLDIQKMLEENPNVLKAQVQVVPAKDSPFADETINAKASVMLRLKSYAEMTQGQIRGMQQAVASAIEGADLKDVSITDQYYNLLTPSVSEEESIGLSQSNLDIRAKMERDYEQKIEKIVGSFLGQDKVQAEVSLDINFDQVETVEKTFGGPDAEGEPQRYSEQTKTETVRRGDAGGDAVGVAANTAQGQIPTAAQAAGGSAIQRNTQTNQYFIDELQTRIRNAPYQIQRMSIALQLDYKELEIEKEKPGFFAKLTKTTPDWIETSVVPLTEEELQNVRDLVVGATGFVANRDFLSVQNFPFKPPISKKARASMETGLLLDYVREWTQPILQLIIFILFVLLLISLFRRFVAPILQQAQLEEEAVAAAIPAGPPKTVAELESELEQEIESSIPNAQLSKSEIMKKRLIEMVQQDPEAVSGLVRTWLIEDD